MNLLKLYCLFFQVAYILNLYQTWQPLFCIIVIMHCSIFSLILTLSCLNTRSESHSVLMSSLFIPLKQYMGSNFRLDTLFLWILWLWASYGAWQKAIRNLSHEMNQLVSHRLGSNKPRELYHLMSFGGSGRQTPFDNDFFNWIYRNKIPFSFSFSPLLPWTRTPSYSLSDL